MTEPTKKTYEQLEAENKQLQQRIKAAAARLDLAAELMQAELNEQMTHAQRNGAVMVWRRIVEDTARALTFDPGDTPDIPF